MLAFLQHHAVTLLLLTLIFLGIVSRNHAISIAAGVLLVVQQTFLAKYLPWLDKYGMKIGIIILTIGVFAPLVSGRIKLPEMRTLLDWKMFVAILMGVFVAWLGGRGVGLMSTQPVLVTGLLLGTLIGVGVFGGIPVGPLVAAGALAVVFDRIG